MSQHTTITATLHLDNPNEHEYIDITITPTGSAPIKFALTNAWGREFDVCHPLRVNWRELYRMYIDNDCRYDIHPDNSYALASWYVNASERELQDIDRQWCDWGIEQTKNLINELTSDLMSACTPEPSTEE